MPAGEAAAWAARLAEGLRAAGLEVPSARAIEPTLEDVFISRIRARSQDEPGQEVA